MSDARAHWREEARAAWLYRALAESEPPGPARELFAKLAGESDRQAADWAGKLGSAATAYRPEPRARIVASLARALGARRVRPMLAAMKVRGLSALAQAPAGHPLPQTISDVGRSHRRGGSAANLRAAVFGASDGLVSNASLVLGMGAAASGDQTVLLAGIAGLLAGASSMAAGEYVSVQSQREMVERQLASERDELERYPEAEAAELALVYEARGMERAAAETFARTLIADPVRALDTLAREELGVDPHELVSPKAAALASFLAFAVGAIVPVLPFVFLRGTPAIATTAATTALALFGVGAATSLFTGSGALRSGVRMLVIGGLAGGITYLVGSIVGVAMG